MTPEAQRIEIAEACGEWSFQPEANYVLIKKRGETVMRYFPLGLEGAKGIEISLNLAGVPDYLNDLNAMHEAEKVLTTDQWFHYNCLLFRSLVPHDDGDEWDASNARHVVHATAAQKAEPFLRAKGKWSTQPTKGASREI